MEAQLDHLVIAAPDLASGVLWCERTLGVTPAPGGAHPLMGTHNRLVRLQGGRFDKAYLEIIAIDPAAKPERQAPRARWFDLDNPAFLAKLERDGAQLAHWVVRTENVADAVGAWQRLGIDRGRILAASRMSARGLLTWQITVRDDGQRLFDGCLPTLIEWGPVHPAPALAEQGVTLNDFSVSHPDAATITEALSVIGLAGVNTTLGPASLNAGLIRPDGALRTLVTPSVQALF